MNLLRMFSWEKYKGEPQYLKKQRTYELIRTVLYFGIAFGTFFAAWAITGNRANIFTIFAVLLCLPGGKSLVETVMFFRYRGCSGSFMDRCLDLSGQLTASFDRVFTSSDRNYLIWHLAISNGVLIAYTPEDGLDEKAFADHLKGLMGVEKLPVPTIKVYKNQESYLKRLGELQPSASEEAAGRLLVLLHQVSL